MTKHRFVICRNSLIAFFKDCIMLFKANDNNDLFVLLNDKLAVFNQMVQFINHLRCGDYFYFKGESEHNVGNRFRT